MGTLYKISVPFSSIQLC